jgi:hypothetical protein
VSQINQAINAVMAAIAKTGISKSQRNQAQGFNYRGIEAAMNELNPILVANGITVTSKYSELNITERAKADGKATRFAIIKGSFTFSVADGSNVVAECYGEAMDSGDKAVVKAQSVAFRTALFQQFVVPTVAVDPEDGTDSIDDDVALIHKCTTLDELKSAWAKLGADYTQARDRDGYKAIMAAVNARKAELVAA